jgi:hypothetical protein
MALTAARCCMVWVYGRLLSNGTDGRTLLHGVLLPQVLPKVIASKRPKPPPLTRNVWGTSAIDFVRANALHVNGSNGTAGYAGYKHCVVKGKWQSPSCGRIRAAASDWAQRLMSRMHDCVRRKRSSIAGLSKMRSHTGSWLSPELLWGKWDAAPDAFAELVEQCLPDANGLGGGMYALHMHRWLRRFPAKAFTVFSYNLFTTRPHVAAEYLAARWQLPPPTRISREGLAHKNAKLISKRNVTAEAAGGARPEVPRSSFSEDASAMLASFYCPVSSQLVPLLRVAGVGFQFSEEDAAAFPDPYDLSSSTIRQRQRQRQLRKRGYVCNLCQGAQHGKKPFVPGCAP